MLNRILGLGKIRIASSNFVSAPRLSPWSSRRTPATCSSCARFLSAAVCAVACVNDSRTSRPATTALKIGESFEARRFMGGMLAPLSDLGGRRLGNHGDVDLFHGDGDGSIRPTVERYLGWLITVRLD